MFMQLNILARDAHLPVKRRKPGGLVWNVTRNNLDNLSGHKCDAMIMKS